MEKKVETQCPKCQEKFLTRVEVPDPPVLVPEADPAKLAEQEAALNEKDGIIAHLNEELAAEREKSTLFGKFEERLKTPDGFLEAFVELAEVYEHKDILDALYKKAEPVAKDIESKEAEMGETKVTEIRMLTADELRQVADIMDNPKLPEGTEHNPDMVIRPKMFTAPSGKVTLEVAFLGKAEVAEHAEEEPVVVAGKREGPGWKFLPALGISVREEASGAATG